MAVDHAASPNDLARAVKRLQAAVALSPGSGGIVDSLGWAYFRAGDLAHADVYLEQAGRLEPGDPEILSHLGDLYAKRQERDRALATYRRALRLSSRAIAWPASWASGSGRSKPRAQRDDETRRARAAGAASGSRWRDPSSAAAARTRRPAKRPYPAPATEALLAALAARRRPSPA